MRSIIVHLNFFTFLIGFLFSGALLQAQETPLPPKEDFHLFLLIGQSNMAGRGRVEAEDKTPHPRVWVLNQENTWAPAVDPLHFDKPKIAGTGLGLTFGKTIAAADPGIHVGLIPCAMGGSALREWKPGSLLYTQAVERARLALQNGTLRGILWHQGESDSSNAESIFAYTGKLQELVGALRADLNAPKAPFIAGELGHFRSAKQPLNDQMNAVLRQVPATIPNAGFVSAKGLEHKGDAVHFDAPSLRELGRRYAAEYLRIRN